MSYLEKMKGGGQSPPRVNMIEVLCPGWEAFWV